MSMTTSSSHFVSKFPIHTMQIDGIVVSYEPSWESLAKSFSYKQREDFLSLLEEAQIRPRQIYPVVLKWKEKYPSIPELDNLLAYVYLQNKEREKAECLIKESFQKYPDYFYAKINYADQCIRNKDFSQIPLIFPSFDLQTLFPEKLSFHVSEFRGFMMVACQYHMAIKQLETAKEYYHKAYLADPGYPGLALLEKKLFPKAFSHKLLSKIRLFICSFSPFQ